MNVNALCNIEGFEIINIANPKSEIEGVYIGDLLSRVMARLEENTAWLTIMSNINILAVSALKEAAVIILCEGVKVDEDVLFAAKEKEINILSTPLTAYEAALALNRALS